MDKDNNQDAFETSLKPLWLRAQAGDTVAYEQALQKIATRLRTFLQRRMSGSPDEVEDLVQETLLAIHLHRKTYDAAFPVSAWVLVIAKHKLIDYWRWYKRKSAGNTPLDEVETSALGTYTQEGAQLDLKRLLDTLPAAQAKAILLTKIEGLSVTEASERTGVSESAIKVQVHRGLKRLSTLAKGFL